jgi:hypothetical protein
MKELTLILKVVKQLAWAHTKGFSDFDQGVNRGCLLAALDFPDIIVMQFGFFSQTLLAHADFFSRSADCFAQDFTMLLGCHCGERKQERQKPTTVFRLYFSACNLLRRGYKQHQLNRVRSPGFQEREPVMKTIRGIVFALAIIVASAIQSLAVDGLKISAQSSDIVLSWPSNPGQTYLILYTKSINPPVQWTVLATGYPAADNTNQTTFIHSGELASGSSGGGAFAAMMASSGESESISTETVETEQNVPLVKLANGTGGTTPLSLYPAGFDFSNYLIYDPATAEWINGSEFSQSEASVSAFDGPALNEPTFGGADAADTVDGATNNCGFYEVFGVTVTGGITNGSAVSGYIQGITVRPEMAPQFLELLVDGQPYPGQDALIPPFTNALSFDWVDTSRLPNGSHTIQVDAIYQVPNLGSEGLHHVLSQPFQIDVFNELSSGS